MGRRKQYNRYKQSIDTIIDNPNNSSIAIPPSDSNTFSNKYNILYNDKKRFKNFMDFESNKYKNSYHNSNLVGLNRASKNSSQYTLTKKKLPLIPLKCLLAMFIFSPLAVVTFSVILAVGGSNPHNDNTVNQGDTIHDNITGTMGSNSNSDSPTTINSESSNVITNYDSSHANNATSAHEAHSIINGTNILYLIGTIIAILALVTIGKICITWASNRSSIMRARNNAKLLEEEKARELDKHLTSEWEGLLERHGKVLEDWNSYDRDLEKLLKLPAMRDFTMPEIGSMIDALDEAELSKTLHYPSGISTVSETAFYRNVRNCENAYSLALKTATMRRDTLMNDHERKQLSLAQQLLRTAMNESASVNERQLSYSRVIAIMEDLSINIPDKITLQIEENTRKLIEA